MKYLPILIGLLFSTLCSTQLETTPYDVVGALTSKQYKYAMSPQNWKGKPTDLDSKFGFKAVDKEIYILSDKRNLIPIEDIPKSDIRVLAGDSLYFIVVVVDKPVLRYYMYHKRKGFVKRIFSK